MKPTKSNAFLSLTIAGIVSLAATPAGVYAAQGSCDDPASIEQLSAKKREMMEKHCARWSKRKVAEKENHERKLAWATAYFQDKPAMWKAYNDNAAQVGGCKDASTDCDPADLYTTFHKALATGDSIIWISRGTSNSGATYTCEKYEFTRDGKTLKNFENYRC